MQFILLTGVAFLCGLVYASFFEWVLHRFVMHKITLGFKYAFEAHAKVHHGTYKGDNTYHAHEKADVKKIPMAWWNGPVLIILSSVPPTLLLSWPLDVWWVTAGVVIAVAVYYATYEYLHWCMHYPKERWFERTKVFKWIDRHHLIHHQQMHRNFNVVLPIADWLLGTLATKSTAR